MTAATFEAGLYLDMTPEDYHADPVPGGSLSSGGARRLLPPGCPALFKYERDHTVPTRRVFEIGHAAHAEALGTGPELVDMGPDDWRTNAIKAKVAEARERGAVPLKTPEYQMIRDMAKVLREHEIAGPLLAMQGHAEASIFWQQYGIWRRARLDWLTDYAVVDYKTADTVEPGALERAMHRYGYYAQGDWYLDAARAVGFDPTAFFLIAQEKTAPYLVTVADPDHNALKVGRMRNREAIDIYRECAATGIWPAYPLLYGDAGRHTGNEVAHLALPAWVETQYLKETR
jgi:hypothetical protein